MCWTYSSGVIRKVQDPDVLVCRGVGRGSGGTWMPPSSKIFTIDIGRRLLQLDPIKRSTNFISEGPISCLCVGINSKPFQFLLNSKVLDEYNASLRAIADEGLMARTMSAQPIPRRRYFGRLWSPDWVPTMNVCSLTPLFQFTGT